MNTVNKLSTGTVETAAKTLISDGKNLADALYERGIDKVNEVEQSVKGYSDDVLNKIHKNPVSSVLISGAIGFVLAFFLRK